MYNTEYPAARTTISLNFSRISIERTAINRLHQAAVYNFCGVE